MSAHMHLEPKRHRFVYELVGATALAVEFDDRFCLPGHPYVIYWHGFRYVASGEVTWTRDRVMTVLYEKEEEEQS